MKQLIHPFMNVLLYEMEQDIEIKEKLKNIKFQSEEANTDEYLKIFFKDYFITKNTINNTKLKKIIISDIHNKYEVDIKELKEFKIINVYLPSDLTDELKKNIKRNNTVYTNPDIYLNISNSLNEFFISIELKSTKNNIIPGSSIQQINPYEWVIFIKRHNNDIDITTGFYINSITEKLPFPDRSPRPTISFNTLEDWNSKNRIQKNNALEIQLDKNVDETKIKILSNWQDFLAEEWLETIKSDSTKKGEKWFNNAIRKFSLILIEYYNKLNSEDKKKLISKIHKNTNNENS